MIRINKVSDVPDFIGCSSFTQYLKDRVTMNLKSLGTDSLEKYGSIFVIQTEDDWKASHEIGLSNNLYKYAVEFAERINLPTDNGGKADIFHACICLTNDFAIDIFCDSSQLPFDTFREWTGNM